MTGRLSRAWIAPTLFLALWVILLGEGHSRFLRDPGTFWHVAIGDKILREGFVDKDPFTFTFAGQPWVPYQWLGEITMALVHRHTGLDGLLAGTTAILAALFAWVAVRLLRTGIHPILALFVVAIGFSASSSHFHVRPHIMTMVFTASLCAAIAAVDAGRIGLRKLWWCVPAFLIWTNIHGGVLGGLTTLGIVGAGWTLFRLFGLQSPILNMRDFAHLTGIGLSCGATVFVTPYGADLPRTWMTIMTMKRLPEIIQEHSPLDFADPLMWSIPLVFFVYLFVMSGVRPREFRASWLIPLFWAMQSCFRVRHSPLFALSAMVFLAEIWPKTRWCTRLAANRPDFQSMNPPAISWLPFGILIPAICLVVSFGLQSSGKEVPLVGKGWAQLDPKVWPVELLDVIKKYEPADPADGHIFNDYVDGAFLIYHAPNYRVFVDDRCELFGEDWLVHFVEASESQEKLVPAMAEWRKTYGRFAFALTRTDTEFDKYFAARPEEWELLKATETANFYRLKGN